ncbi:hypothetical protein [Actinacidiphila acididurans]|uniref:Tat pathway signal sequence domain protein n=1 Tax=Actinacidiphila acididurans TaxID=2784346 RepID=A0ABS2TST8_9ACTN|nr:hypothetical protein [Actinacidiphila acididurans]MBM9506403.1 hypothetical protein [Actinacidiphila acididurans]
MTPKRARLTGRSALAAATVAALGAAGTLVAVPAAQAAAPVAAASTTSTAAHGATSTTFVIPPGVSTYKASTGAAGVTVTRSPKVSPNVAITCTVTASEPFRFYGGPFPWPSGVEGIAHTTCSNIVNSIDMLVVLFKGTTALSSSERISYQTLQAAADTEYQYSSGSYQTGAIASVTFPDGSSGTSSPAYSAVTTIP